MNFYILFCDRVALSFKWILDIKYAFLSLTNFLVNFYHYKIINKKFSFTVSDYQIWHNIEIYLHLV